jgi:hypothetical protein
MSLYSVARNNGRQGGAMARGNTKLPPRSTAEVDRHFPDSQCVGCDFPSQGGAPQRNSIRSRPVHSKNGETLGPVGPELVASPSSRRTSPVAMAWFLEGFDTADLNRGNARRRAARSAGTRRAGRWLALLGPLAHGAGAAGRRETCIGRRHHRAAQSGLGAGIPGDAAWPAGSAAAQRGLSGYISASANFASIRK